MGYELGLVGEKLGFSIRGEVKTVMGIIDKGELSRMKSGSKASEEEGPEARKRRLVEEKRLVKTV